MLAILASLQSIAAGSLTRALFLCSMSFPCQPGIPEASRDAWLALLHYSHDGAAWVSDVKDQAFFLDVGGPHSPEREWRAARLAFLAPAGEPTSRHAQCRFPARFALMKDALGWSRENVPHIDCPEFAAHERKLNASSLSVVFVSHFLNNPASAFGHTMLYLGTGSNQSATLADYSVSFEANTDGLSPATYIPRALSGGLVARYRIAPLYERVQRYEREEQRDLWMFPLRVSQREIDQLVRHLWELKDVTFQYGFFGANCAQKILAVVHAVAPSYKVLPQQSLAVLPSEVARRLVGKIGLADAPTRRPSLWAQYSRQVATLSEVEREQVKAMIAKRIVVRGASPAAISAALSWSEFKAPDRAFRRASDTEDHADLLWRRALWVARVGLVDGAEGERSASQLSDRSFILQSHRPSAFTVRGGYRSGTGAVTQLGARWLLHSAVDAAQGYPPISSIEVGRVRVEVDRSGRILLDDATILLVEKLAPASTLQSALAWKVDIGARRLAYNGYSPLHVGAEVGLGAGAALLRPTYSYAAYSMVGVRPGAVLTTGRASFLAAGVWSAGMLLHLPGDFRARIWGEYALSFSSFRGGAAGLKAVFRKGVAQDWDLELASTISPNRRSVMLGVVSFR